MIFNHVRELSRDYGVQRECEALIDDVSLADYNVLSLIDENTAGIDRVETEEKNVLFYNLGASSL